MAKFPFTRKPPEHYHEQLRIIVEAATELSSFHDCKVYIFVDRPQHGFIFKSIQDPLWPPPDQYLETRKLSIKRLYGEDLAYLRLTDLERKDLIQLLLFFSYLACRWELASRIHAPVAQSPRSLNAEESETCEVNEGSAR